MQGFNNIAIFKPTQHYHILSALDQGKALDVSQTDPERGLILWDKGGNKNNQLFKLIPNLNGKYNIISLSDGAVQARDGSGTVCCGKQNGSLFEQWTIKPTGQNGSYSIMSCLNKMLDVCGAQTANGTKVIQYNAGNGHPPNQTWYIVKA